MKAFSTDVSSVADPDPRLDERGTDSSLHPTSTVIRLAVSPASAERPNLDALERIISSFPLRNTVADVA